MSLALCRRVSPSVDEPPPPWTSLPLNRRVSPSVDKSRPFVDKFPPGLNSAGSRRIQGLWPYSVCRLQSKFSCIQHLTHQHFLRSPVLWTWDKTWFQDHVLYIYGHIYYCHKKWVHSVKWLKEINILFYSLLFYSNIVWMHGYKRCCRWDLNHQPPPVFPCWSAFFPIYGWKTCGNFSLSFILFHTKLIFPCMQGNFFMCFFCSIQS